MKKWVELIASGPFESTDDAIEILVDNGSPGALEEERNEEDRKRSITRIKGSIAQNDTLALEKIRKSLGKIGWKVEARAYTDGDWTVKWKRFIKPLKVGTIFIKPTWVKKKPANAKIVINIDPGMAFGTGNHPTTKNCVKAIYELATGKIKSEKVSKANLLDVGTGSGILAIVGKKLGFKKVVGTDNDTEALVVAAENAGNNSTKIVFSTKKLSSVNGSFGLVVANILAVTILELKHDLIKKVKKGCYLVLSGILRTEGGEVIDAFTGAGLQKIKTYNEKEWTTIVLKK